MRRVIIVLLACSSILGLTGCGVKGDPLPVTQSDQ